MVKLMVTFCLLAVFPNNSQGSDLDFPAFLWFLYHSDFFLMPYPTIGLFALDQSALNGSQASQG